jgi:HK97 family phage major capsid protein
VFNLKELKEERAKALSEVEAINAVAKEDKRDLNDEEAARIDAILGTKDKPGEIAAIEAKIERAERFEAKRREIVNQHHQHKIEEQQDQLDEKPAIENFKIPAKAKSHGPLRAYKGDSAERDAYVAGQVILAGMFGSQSASRWCDDHGLKVNASLSTGDNSKGGFITTDEMQNALVRLREERGVFPRYANSFPMGADIVKVPRLLSDVTAYWVGESSEITASDPSLGQAELMAKKLAALTKFSSEVDEDAVIQIGDMITTSMAYALADKIDDAAFNGDGTSTYGGVLGLKSALESGAIQDAAAGNTAATTLDLADFEQTVGLYPQYPGASPTWFMHSAVYWSSAARLMNAGGGNNNDNLANGPMMTFLGYPVQFVQVMPSTTGVSASTILAYFGDLRLGATYGTRRSMNTQVSTERYFETDEIAIRTTERVAINIHERGDTIRTRPIVALKTAS